MGKDRLCTHAIFGDTNRADGVPSAHSPSSVPGLPSPSDGPVYLEGRLVLSLSFAGGPADVRCEDSGELIERYRVWDERAQRWHADGLEVLRFEQADVVVRLGRKPAVLWQGAIDTRSPVIPAPDLDKEGIADNGNCDLRWKRI